MICRYKIKFISDIEQKIRKLLVNIAVAPFVGVWIEMNNILKTKDICKPSLPSWKCGLKFEENLISINVNIKMYIFDHLRMYIFAILPLDRYIFLSDKIFL